MCFDMLLSGEGGIGLRPSHLGGPAEQIKCGAARLRIFLFSAPASKPASRQNEKCSLREHLIYFAEREGFEPSIQV
jgi:hypothetical protein